MKRPLNKIRHSTTRTAITSSVLSILLLSAFASVILTSVPVRSENLSPPQWIGIFEEKGAVTLRWFRVQGAIEYAVFRVVGTGETFQEIGRARNPVFTDYGVLPGQILHYKVIPYDSQGMKGPPSDRRYIQTASEVPGIFNSPEMSTYQVRADGIALTWRHEDAASVLVFNVYRRKEGDKDYSIVFSTKGMTYLDKDVIVDATYNYTVTALNVRLQESDPSEPLTITFRVSQKSVSPPPSVIQGIKVLEEVVNPTELIRAFSWKEYGFISPVDVAFWEKGERYYISDAATGEITVIGARNNIVQRLGGRGNNPWEFERLLGIGVDREGYVYGVDAYRAEIVVFTPTGFFERRIRIVEQLREYFGQKYPEYYPGQRFGLVDLVIDDQGNLFVTDNPNGRIYVLDQYDKLTEVMADHGDQPGHFQYPTFLARKPGDLLVISDTMNSRVQVLNGSGEAVRLIGEKGLGIGQFIRPKGITVDREGFLYVADSFSNSIQVFSDDGDFVALLADEEGLPLDLGSPNGILFLAPDRLVICERLTRRIQVRKVYLRQDLPYFSVRLD